MNTNSIRTFTGREVALILGMRYRAYVDTCKYYKAKSILHIEKNKPVTKENVIALYNFLNGRTNATISSPDFSKVGEPTETTIIKTDNAIPTFTLPSTDTIEGLIECAETLERMNNTPAVQHIKSQKEVFEKLTTDNLKQLFEPVLARFKYSYIASVIHIQTQTLTCIRQGKLRGMNSYELSFPAFLKLLKFASDNNVHLDMDIINSIQ